MNTSPTPRSLSIWLFAAILGIVLTLAPASASVIEERPAAAFDTTLDAETGAVTDEPAAALLEPEAASGGISVFSVSQCSAGYFCVWSLPNYVGTIQRFSSQSQYTSISLSKVGSFYNNRSKRVYVYGDPSGSPSACYGAQAKRTGYTGWLLYAEGTYLSTATSC